MRLTSRDAPQVFAEGADDPPDVDLVDPGTLSDVLLALKVGRHSPRGWYLRVSVVSSDQAGVRIHEETADALDEPADLPDYAPLLLGDGRTPTRRTHAPRWLRPAAVAGVALVALLLATALVLSAYAGRAVVPDVAATVAVPAAQQPAGGCGRAGGCTTEEYRAAGTSARTSSGVCFTSNIVGGGPQGGRGQG